MTHAFERRYQEMTRGLKGFTFQQFYNIQPELGNKVMIDATKTNNANEMKIIIQYHEPIYYDIFELPMDISRVVSSYLSSYIIIEFIINYPSDYPFNPPRWSVDSVKHNIHSLPIDVLDYYQYIVQKHNDILRNDWSPGIHIDRDLLAFVQKINHFEYILHPDTFTP
jgi:ubiquitin-protein ligase